MFILSGDLCYAEEKNDEWKTIIHNQNDTLIELLWRRGGYEEFDHIISIQKVTGGKIETKLAAFGQPKISTNNKCLALKNCWHGGCEHSVKIINLETMLISKQIDTSRGEFITLTWIENNLKIELFSPSPVDKVSEIIINCEK